MTKTILIAAVALAVLAPSAFAKDPETLLKKGQIAQREGRLQEALEIYELVVEEWPENPNGHLLLASCLANLGRLEGALEHARRAAGVAGEDEKARAAARDLERMIREHGKEKAKREYEEKAVAEALEKVERRLKEKGLEGEELERAFRTEKERLLAQLEAKRTKEAAARAIELYKELGMKESELAERRAEFEKRRVELEELKRHAEKLKAYTSELDRKRAQMEEEIRRKEEERWKRERGEDLEAARREFLELAKRLGIPPEAADKLLAEHRDRRTEIPTVRVRDLVRELDEVRGQVHEVKRHVEALIEKLNAAFAEMRDREEWRAHESKLRFHELRERIEALERKAKEPR